MPNQHKRNNFMRISNGILLYINLSFISLKIKLGNIKILPCNQSIKFFIMIHQALDMYWIRYINSQDEALLSFYGFLISQSFPFFGFYRYKKANSQKQLKVLFVLRQSFLLYNVNCYQLNSIIWSSCIKIFLIYLHLIL